MGLFTVARPTGVASQVKNVELLHRYECQACPLRYEHKRDMKPRGNKRPLVYMLGEAPNKDAERVSRQFGGKASNALMLRIPEKWHKDLRWNNIVRTRPSKGGQDRLPSPEEVEACRPSIIRDIELTKPDAIFGFGSIAIHWALGLYGVDHIVGRRFPVKIGTHTCWFYPMLNPGQVHKSRPYWIDREITDPRKWGGDIEFGFMMDMKRAFKEVEAGLPEPRVHTRVDAMKNVDFVMDFTDKGVERILKFIDGLMDEKFVGFDYETNCLRPYSKGAKFLTVALSGANRVLGIPLKHRQSRWSPEQLERIMAALAHFMRKHTGVKCVHNLVFEHEWSAHFFGRKILRKSKWGCSTVQAWVLDERQKRKGSGIGPMALAFLTKQYFGIDVKALNPVDRKNLDDVPLDQVLTYNCVDAKYHRFVFMAQAHRVVADKLEIIYRQHVRRVATVVLTQRKGIPIHKEATHKLFRKYYKRREWVAKKLAKLKTVRRFKTEMGYEYRPAAIQDVRFLVEKLLPRALTEKALSEDGDLTQADAKGLEKIKHAAVAYTVRWRKANKVLTTYIEPVIMDEEIDGIEVEPSEHMYPDGLAHPITNICRVTTSRTSSDNFNYQNWPKRDGERREVRQQISAGPGFSVVSFDYAGIQARNVAMESLDEALIKAFWNRYDIHADWTERIVKRFPKWIKEGSKQLATDKALFKSYRNRAKNEFVFPSFFGAQPKSLAKYLGISEELCKSLHEEFWSMFPDIKGWHERITSFYQKTGYVTGLSGYRRRYPISPNELINAPIQADEAAIVLEAMSRLSEMELWQYQPNMEIHDDLTFIWPTKKVDQYAETVISTMLYPTFKWAQVVPIGVEMSVGNDWFTQKASGEYFSDKWDHKTILREDLKAAA